ncbi:Glutaredoxin [Rhodotorula toruloides ATCC 204091]|nr:Glutaredoxin [Rhodotorula toruloides ATCC 204091]
MRAQERGRGRAWRRKREETQAAGDGAARRRQRWRVRVSVTLAVPLCLPRLTLRAPLVLARSFSLSSSQLGLKPSLLPRPTSSASPPSMSPSANRYTGPVPTCPDSLDAKLPPDFLGEAVEVPTSEVYSAALEAAWEELGGQEQALREGRRPDPERVEHLEPDPTDDSKPRPRHYGAYALERASLDWSYHVLPSKARQALQDQIVKLVLEARVKECSEAGDDEPCRVSERREGGMGAGKGHTLREMLKTGRIRLPANTVWIDPDALSRLLPERPLYLSHSASTASSLLHPEASLLQEICAAVAKSQKRSLVIDGSLTDCKCVRLIDNSSDSSSTPCTGPQTLYDSALDPDWPSSTPTPYSHDSLARQARERGGRRYAMRVQQTVGLARALCSLARLTATTRTRPDVPLLTPGHSADLTTPPSSLLSSFLLPHALARMTSRSRSSNTASSALLPQEEALYSEGKHRWRDEDSSSSDGSDGSDASSDGDEEEKPRRRRRRAQPVQQGSSNSSLVILLAVACIAAIALALFFALRKTGGESDSAAGNSGAASDSNASATDDATDSQTASPSSSSASSRPSRPAPTGSGGTAGSSGKPSPTNSGGSTNNPKPSSSNSASNPSPSSGGGSTDSFASACLAAHNDFRATHHADPLAWNATLAAAAEKWTKNCQWKHSGGAVGPFGENLFMVSPVDQNAQLDPKPGIGSWNDEEKMYDYNNPGFTHETGHFTQTIWKATTQLGCYYGKCNGIMKGGELGAFLVCEVGLVPPLVLTPADEFVTRKRQYYPAGNMVGDNNKYFRENVLPP